MTSFPNGFDSISTLAIIISFFGLIANVNAECFSLRGSSACPGYENYYLSTEAGNMFSWHPRNDVKAFDRALANYVGSHADTENLQAIFRCDGLDKAGKDGSTNTDLGQSNIRYRRSVLCAQMIASEKNIGECYPDSTKNDTATFLPDDINKQSDTSVLRIALSRAEAEKRKQKPLPLCKSTCLSWADSISNLTKNSTLCPKTTNIDRKVNMNGIYQMCNLSELNGEDGECLKGDVNEKETCGYKRVEDWCRYCKYSVKHKDICESVGVEVKDIPDEDLEDASMDANSDNMIDLDSYDSLENEYDALLDRLAREESKLKQYRAAAIALAILFGLTAILLGLYVFYLWRRHVRARDLYVRSLSQSTLTPDTSLKKMGTAYLGAPIISNSSTAAATTNGSGMGLAAHNQHREVGFTDLSQSTSPSDQDDFIDIFLRSVNKTRAVVRPFFGRREDEISLQKGDFVQIHMAFDDGWVVGRNVRTDEEGSFPLMCIVDDLPSNIPAEWSTITSNSENRRTSIHVDPSSTEFNNQGTFGKHRSLLSSVVSSDPSKKSRSLSKNNHPRGLASSFSSLRNRSLGPKRHDSMLSQVVDYFSQYSLFNFGKDSSAKRRQETKKIISQPTQISKLMPFSVNTMRSMASSKDTVSSPENQFKPGSFRVKNQPPPQPQVPSYYESNGYAPVAQNSPTKQSPKSDFASTIHNNHANGDSNKSPNSTVRSAIVQKQHQQQQQYKPINNRESNDLSPPASPTSARSKDSPSPGINELIPADRYNFPPSYVLPRSRPQSLASKRVVSDTSTITEQVLMNQDIRYPPFRNSVSSINQVPHTYPLVNNTNSNRQKLSIPNEYYTPDVLENSFSPTNSTGFEDENTTYYDMQFAQRRQQQQKQKQGDQQQAKKPQQLSKRHSQPQMVFNERIEEEQEHQHVVFPLDRPTHQNSQSPSPTKPESKKELEQ